MKLAYCICGSFCNHSAALKALEALIYDKHDITPVLSERVQHTNTRFGKSNEYIEKVEALCGKTGIKTVESAEAIITGGGFDCVIVSPCTGNTLAKIASAMTDCTVPMAVKAQLRVHGTVLIALASNDGLGGTLQNIASLIERKNVFFVPFGQDNAQAKPLSLVCNFSLIPETLAEAKQNKQIQPILL